MFLADTTAWYGRQAPQTWEKRAQDVVAKPREQQVPFQVDRWFTEGFRRRHPAEANRVVAIFLRTSSLAHAQACRALGTMDSRGLLPKITAPVLGGHRHRGLCDAAGDGKGNRRRGAGGQGHGA